MDYFLIDIGAYPSFYNHFLIGMIILAIVVFIALQFVTPAYGMTFNNRWGASINSRISWMIMETPVFVAMTIIYVSSLVYGGKPFNFVTLMMFIFFQVHYFQRSLIFPILMKGNSKMPLSIIIIGAVFNISNAYMQGSWLFFFSPSEMYTIDWFWSPQFIIGTILFFFGMTVNMHSDRMIRKLRKSKDDDNYYLPKGFLFKRINSSNYFGEIVEWIGFAILTWSIAGLVFVLWTFANIVPRAKAVNERYTQFFGEEFTKLKRWKIFPYIY